MKKMMRPAAVLLALVLLAGALSGCTAGEEQKLHEKAAEYVKKLQNDPAVSDSFTLSNERVKFSDKAASVPFAVKSETYGTYFTVWVSREEGQTVTDDYYCLYLRQEAEDKVSALLAEVLGAGLAEAAVEFGRFEHPALSGHAAGSLEEFLQIAADQVGTEDLLSIRLRNPEQVNPEAEAIDKLLFALQEKGYYCKLYPYVSDAVWFDVMKDGFWITKQTGADSGAYLQRDPYTPSAPAAD